MYMYSEAGFRFPIESYKEGRRAYYRYSNSIYSKAMQQINPIEAGLLKTALNMLGRFKDLQKFDFIQELTLKLKKLPIRKVGNYILIINESEFK